MACYPFLVPFAVDMVPLLQAPYNVPLVAPQQNPGNNIQKSLVAGSVLFGAVALAWVSATHSPQQQLRQATRQPVALQPKASTLLPNAQAVQAASHSTAPPVTVSAHVGVHSRPAPALGHRGWTLQPGTEALALGTAVLVMFVGALLKLRDAFTSTRTKPQYWTMASTGIHIAPKCPKKAKMRLLLIPHF